MEVNRQSNIFDILYYLSKKYPFSYDKENDYPILRTFDEKRINIINESNIKDGAELYLILKPSIKLISKNKKSKDCFSIMLKTTTGLKIPVEVWDDLTIINLKQIVEFLEDIPVDEQRMIFEGKQMNDSKTIKDNNIKNGSIIHIVLRLRG